MGDINFCFKMRYGLKLRWAKYTFIILKMQISHFVFIKYTGFSGFIFTSL